MAIQSLRALPGIGLKNVQEGTTLYNARWRRNYERRIRLHPKKRGSDEDLISALLEIDGVVSLIVTKKMKDDTNVVLQKRDDASWDPIMERVSLLLKETRSDRSEVLIGSAALTR